MNPPLARIPLLGLLLLFAALAATQAQAAPNYIQAPPFSQTLGQMAVADPAPGKPLQLPMITWGGDIATILANGNSPRTKPGSLFDQQGLDIQLVRKDVFADQLKDYLSGKSPFLRGTLGMVNMAAELLSRDPRTRPVPIYQLTWSAGGDALVVKPGIHATKDLKGKTIALQAYGPHVDYLSKILADAGLSPADVQLRWLPDLTGSANSPAAALAQAEVDAALVIIPDAMLLTSGGAVGTGAEDSVKGARILLSTRTANRIIADVYAVRIDYLAANRAQIQTLVQALLQAQEQTQALFRNPSAEHKALTSASAQLLLDSPQATADVEGLYADASFVGWQGNLDFFANPNFPRSAQRLTQEAQQAFIGLGLLSAAVPLTSADWDYAQLKGGLKTGAAAPTQQFDSQQVAAVVARKQQQDSLGEGELFSFEIFFKPNQNDFTPDLYQDAFNRVIDLAATYGGALITVEGHSDPMGYLRKKKDGEQEIVLGRIKQSAKNLSLSRAVAVRDSVINFAQGKNISLDPSQFAVVGHGIGKPKSGICGNDPCAPKSEKDWRDNMRVVFRVIQVEAESSVFSPL
ncbi:MAG: ABC transporter substrate-binding protein [Gammaproteobacteria bacterium]|nr:ABC transporter substrate-binding protein [Gammaproteobacteria bacterium]